jgi:hypothetical protein
VASGGSCWHRSGHGSGGGGVVMVEVQRMEAVPLQTSLEEGRVKACEYVR